MVAITATSSYAALSGYGVGYNAAHRSTPGVAIAPPPDSAATEVTLSDAARSAMAERDLATVLNEARSKLSALLEEAGRTSPLHEGKLALDLASLDHRELYAIASDESFSEDERKAAGLEMQRRFEAALAGPAAIALVTDNYTGLYKAAAAYLDALGPEERASTDWKAGRDAVSEGLKQLASAPDALPDAGDSDPVALYLALQNANDTIAPPSMDDLAGNTRTALDKLYAEARANGRAPSFNRATTTGTFIDMTKFSGRALSSVVLDTEGRFTGEEVNAARNALQTRGNATLLAGFQSASKSGDPTAFSQNIIAAFTSLSPEERQAVGWSNQLYEAAMQSYTSTTKLLGMFNQASGNAGNGFSGLLGR